MPYKRKTYKRRHRKGAKKATRSLTAYRPKYQSGVPAQQMVKLVYTEDALIKNITGAAPWLYDGYRLNSLFDPRQAAGGHQPRFFDQWTAMYERYRITGAKVEVEAYNQTNGGIATLFLIPLHYNAAVFTSSQQAFENKKVSSAMLTDQKPVKLTRYFNIAQVEGVKRTVVANDQDYAAGMGGDPPRFPTVQVAVSSLRTGDVNDIVLRTRITYYGKVFQPKTVGAS